MEKHLEKLTNLRFTALFPLKNNTHSSLTKNDRLLTSAPFCTSDRYRYDCLYIVHLYWSPPGVLVGVGCRGQMTGGRLPLSAALCSVFPRRSAEDEAALAGLGTPVNASLRDEMLSKKLPC